jgi:hypothetical protein
MDTVGYAIIKQGAKGISAIGLEAFYGHPVRVLEFASDGGVMVLDNKATGIATFDKPDVVRSFRCRMHGHVVCPPDADILGRMAYATRAMMRKGGYPPMVTHLVVAASLHRGEFTDSLLWAKQ